MRKGGYIRKTYVFLKLGDFCAVMHTQSFLEDTSFIRKLLAFNNLIISSFCEFKIPLKMTSPSILRQLRMSGIMSFITSARILHKIKSKFFNVYFETNESNGPR